MGDITKIYPTIPSAPKDATYQEQYHIQTVQEEFRELIKLKSTFHEKYKKYKKILERMLIVNSSSSALSIEYGYRYNCYRCYICRRFLLVLL